MAHTEVVIRNTVFGQEKGFGYHPLSPRVFTLVQSLVEAKAQAVLIQDAFTGGIAGNTVVSSRLKPSSAKFEVFLLAMSYQRQGVLLNEASS